MGVTWEEISPDLTRNIDEKQGNGGGPYTNEAVGAENYGTLAYMIESPHEKGVFWTGSDDGLVHVTKNGGETWENVTPKGFGETLVNAIEVSPHDAATAYIATTRYKFNDYTPALYKTTDYGKTWTNISGELPYGAFTRVVREDEQRKGLLYAGTEKGMYISYDDGKTWESFQLNLPKTPILDLKVHQGDLIVATSGRSFWILDDLAVIANYRPTAGGLQLFEPEAAYNGSWGSPMSGNTDTFDGTHPFEGVNPANGIVVYYQLPKLAEKDSITLEIRNAEGRLIRTLSSEKDADYIPHNGGSAPPKPLLPKKEGLNRFVWDMGYPIMPGIPGVYIEAGFRGHKVPPGMYTITLKANGETKTANAEIKEVPLYETKPGQYEAFDALMTEMEDKVTEMHQMVNQLFKVQNQLSDILKDLSDEELKTAGDSLVAKMKCWDEDMVQRKSKAYDDVENFPNKFTAEYLFLINQTNSSIQRVNAASLARKAELDKQWIGLKATGEALIRSDIPDFNKKLWDAGVGAIRF